MNKKLILLLITSLLPLHAQAAKLSIDDYLAQVTEQNPAMQSSAKSASAAELRSNGADIATTPFLFATHTRLDDQKETMTPTFQGTRTQSADYSIGVGFNSTVGLAGKYTFNINKLELQNATLVTQPNIYTSYNQIELSQSLWKNGFGSEIRAQKAAIENGLLAQSAAQKFLHISQQVEAENAYWRLAFARKSIELEKGVLERSQKLMDWAQKRVKNQLGDKSDTLQAVANYQLRKLDLNNLIEEEKNAARAFNNLRGIDSEKVEESLPIPEAADVLKIPSLEKKGMRLDVVASELQVKASTASTQLDYEKTKPQLDLFGSVAWNGRDAKRPEAVKESYHNNHDTVVFGVKFSTPIDVPSMWKIRKGVIMQQEADALLVQKKHMDETQEWQELNSRLADAKSRLRLLQDLEKVQQEKSENERQRLLRGRSTTYQALIFEQDYSQSMLLRLRTQAETLQLLSRLKLFRGEL